MHVCGNTWVEAIKHKSILRQARSILECSISFSARRAKNIFSRAAALSLSTFHEFARYAFTCHISYTNLSNFATSNILVEKRATRRHCADAKADEGIRSDIVIHWYTLHIYIENTDRWVTEKWPALCTVCSWTKFVSDFWTIHSYIAQYSVTMSSGRNFCVNAIIGTKSAVQLAAVVPIP